MGFEVLTGLIALMLAGILAGALALVPARNAPLISAGLSARIPHAFRLPAHLARRMQRRAEAHVAASHSTGATVHTNPAQGPPLALAPALARPG